MSIDPNRLAFMQGVLAGLASNGQVIHYSGLRRLCRLSQEQLGAYLGAARQDMVAAGQPDFCSLVVKDSGWPGKGWGDLAEWPTRLREAHKFWRDRRRLDNTAFCDIYGKPPETPGIP
ncbi:MAG: hypothetical protein H6725_12515 [Sandaracinaceae bacterium]|nr:hypothetical protein [Sandaracinaceae bacterium]